jgi:PqqD family protein of HPr-rel-A system
VKIEEAPLQGELMLFDPEQSRFFVLNRTMTALWRRCDGETTLDGMLDSVRTGFKDTETAPVEDEIRDALGQLMELGLVVSVSVDAR